MWVCMLSMALSGTALVALVRGSTANTIHAETSQVAATSKLMELTPMGPCEGEAQIRLSQPIHSNLGNKGPDTGDEGIVYPGVNIQPGMPNQEVLVVVNATNDGVDTRSNGIWGKYAGIAVNGGTMMHANFAILDKNTRNPVVIRELDVTFFDLDRHMEGQGVEYIKIKKPDQYFLTKNTLLEVSEGDDGYVAFKATANGNSADNPQDPLFLTTEQKNKAVTVRYKDVDKFEVELGSEGYAGNYRGFIFVLRPSLLCAKTSDGEDPQVVTETLGTTTTPTAVGVVEVEETTTKRKEKRCLFTVPIINWCIPKFW